ncbi:FHA domain-containing protein [Paramicrobacterium humi]|uniref:FHA domain-containing protein n=1 Tax=Paramicrobacterium humi TaxID=640635 RepID=UPI0015A11BED|nr:FHA domain-containing protein [Microbacterium humi]
MASSDSTENTQPATWNGRPIPPRPPLPAAEPSTDERPAAPRRFIGMPPGMQAELDTVPAGERHVPAPPAPPENVDAADAPVLVFPGDKRVALTGSILVGRDPGPHDGYPDAALVPLGDRSVSKTHAVVQFSRGGVWVTDLGSTNGTNIVDLAQRETVCVPGVATAAYAGGGILFGTVLATLAPGDSDGGL